MKILLLSPNQINKYNWSHQLFRNEIGRQHDVVYYGEGFPKYIPEKPIPEIIKEIGNIDLILTYGLRYTEPFIGIGDVTNIPKVHISVDYFPDSTGGRYDRNHKLFNRDKYSLYFGVVSHITRNLENNGVCNKAYLLPFSVDTNIYRRKDVIIKRYDVFAVFTKRNDTYPNRHSIHKMLSKARDLNIFTDKIQHEDYIDKINDSRICITSNNKFKSLSIKYVEVLACGGFLLADKPEDFDELGYINNRHLSLYDDLDDLGQKIRFFIKNEDLRNSISSQGMEFVRRNHSNEIRVKEMTKIIREVLGIK